ncbi:aldehyde dehydrogenase family protein [Jatrophihabitans sp. DSM 45814]
MQQRDWLLINGARVPSTGASVIEVIDSTSEKVLATVPDGTAEDVDRAVAAAVAAFPAWSQTSPDARADFLVALAAGLKERSLEAATSISREVGHPVHLAQTSQLTMAIADLMALAEVTRSYAWQEEIANALVVREPVGVVAAITPWNFPLHQISVKVGAALAAGCTVVLKPSEVAPLTGYIFTEVIESIGLPAGVFNLVSGTGPIVGEALAAHPNVDMVSLTGSTRAGRRVMELAAGSIKRVGLELGGKSAAVLLEGAPIDRAVRHTVDDCFRNSGQVCAGLTRLVVPRSHLPEVERIAAEQAATYIPGDPDSETTTLGPLASKAQQDRVRGYIEKGVAEGARLVTGGAEAPDGFDLGYYVQPTVFSDVTNTMTIAQEEIFGPVLSILAYDTEDEAVAIANDSPYGLGGAVWGRDADQAVQVGRKIRTGRVIINGGAWNPYSPFGGYKQSGLGREIGRYGIEDFLEVKSLLR